MFDRKSAKKAAKKNLKKHYWIYVVSCFLASFLGIEYILSLEPVNTVVVQAPSIVQELHNGDSSVDVTPLSRSSAFEVYKEIVIGNAEKGREIAEAIIENNKNTSSVFLRTIELGHKDGVFARIANAVSSGSPFVTIFDGIRSIVGNTSAANIIFIILSLIIILTLWIVFVNTFNAVYKRIFLSGYTYEKVPISTFIHFVRVRRYFRACISMLVVSCLKLLWMFTIVGGVIKYFAYFMVPYIVAENPSVSPMEAIRLSEKMMYGHKMECFKLKLTLIGWSLLDIATLGIGGIFFSNPYKECVLLEYYVHIRALAKENNIENSEILNDEYLYKKMDSGKLREVYSDYVVLSDMPEPENLPGNAVWRFFANVFGVVPAYSDTEHEYFRAQQRKTKISACRKIIEGKIYPERLNPIPEKQKEKRVEYIGYQRHYSILSLVVMFFLFSFMGWFWEVCFHLVEEGRFVNRGVLHGPWIPIYGTGGVMILILLNKLRSRPVIEFIVSVVMCGVVEYFTGVALEELHGERWWDYSGYFLNINGRVCAEGLLVFGVAGVLVVYVIAPFTDNLLRKIRFRYLFPVCLLLLSVFVADVVCSAFYPNSGAGINDFPITSQSEDGQMPLSGLTPLQLGGAPKAQTPSDAR